MNTKTSLKFSTLSTWAYKGINYDFKYKKTCLGPNLTSQTVTFYKHVDQSEISATKKAFVSNPKLYKHDPVFGCVCLSDKHEFPPES